MGYKFLVAACVAVAVSAEADPGYVAVAAPALLNSYPNRPGVSTPYSQSTCYGCYGYAPYAYGVAPYRYGYGLGVAGHPGAATSFVARSPQGLGKRSADALYGYGIVPVTTSTYGYGPSGYGIAQGHPGYASSFQQVTRLH